MLLSWRYWERRRLSCRSADKRLWCVEYRSPPASLPSRRIAPWICQILRTAATKLRTIYVNNLLSKRAKSCIICYIKAGFIEIKILWKANILKFYLNFNEGVRTHFGLDRRNAAGVRFLRGWRGTATTRRNGAGLIRRLLLRQISQQDNADRHDGVREQSPDRHELHQMLEIEQ